MQPSREIDGSHPLTGVWLGLLNRRCWVRFPGDPPKYGSDAFAGACGGLLNRSWWVQFSPDPPFHANHPSVHDNLGFGDWCLCAMLGGGSHQLSKYLSC